MTSALAVRAALRVMGLLSTALASPPHLVALPPDSTLSQPPNPTLPLQPDRPPSDECIAGIQWNDPLPLTIENQHLLGLCP
ncbi:MAG: hypothetical protein AAGH67_02630 [Cyanobacteria bacterium P01_H01_bin.162]